MKHHSRKKLFLSLFLLGALGGFAANTMAQPQDDQEAKSAESSSKATRSKENRNSRSGGKSAKAEVLYPNATRTAPTVKASAKMGPKLQKMIDAFNKDDFDKARVAADEILATESANQYDKSLAAQIAGQAVYNQDDDAKAKEYLAQSIELNGLDNNGHYQAMFMLAQLYMMDEEYAKSLEVLEKYLSETKSQKAEELVVKGNILYRMERYQEAIPLLKQAIETSSAPKSEWTQLLMASYSESDQPLEAVKLAEQLAQKNPTDKKTQINLASIYMQADLMNKSAEVLEKLRSVGQLTDEREYRQLYATYLNMEGKEGDAIAVINEGLEKGILKPDYQNFIALAQSYYFSDKVSESIDAYKKAAPLATDGETFLNLAKVLWQEDRIPEAKQAAKQALDKGLKNPAEATKIINLK